MHQLYRSAASRSIGGSVDRGQRSADCKHKNTRKLNIRSGRDFQLPGGFEHKRNSLGRMVRKLNLTFNTSYAIITSIDPGALMAPGHDALHFPNLEDSACTLCLQRQSPTRSTPNMPLGVPARMSHASYCASLRYSPWVTSLSGSGTHHLNGGQVWGGSSTPTHVWRPILSAPASWRLPSPYSPPLSASSRPSKAPTSEEPAPSVINVVHHRATAVAAGPLSFL